MIIKNADIYIHVYAMWYVMLTNIDMYMLLLYVHIYYCAISIMIWFKQPIKQIIWDDYISSSILTNQNQHIYTNFKTSINLLHQISKLTVLQLIQQNHGLYTQSDFCYWTANSNSESL